ncbi:PREDICTED: uncharacterized protein LOC103336321 isoform X1 [Prunus mume]|uniref:Uncharacterized protein LOC103336321 isoform X1 n=1 Tax=Prunus mume TaxID=102107 RepID=A0ABM0PCE7_PRUMU|nr:PREDICTED: uncharacterized protein LOC103336321 isoform X1 [Prunus mume]
MIKCWCSNSSTLSISCCYNNRCTSGTVYHFVSQKLKVFFLKSKLKQSLCTGPLCWQIDGKGPLILVEQKRMAGEGSTVNWSMPPIFVSSFTSKGVDFNLWMMHFHEKYIQFSIWFIALYGYGK